MAVHPNLSDYHTFILFIDKLTRDTNVKTGEKRKTHAKITPER